MIPFLGCLEVPSSPGMRGEDQSVIPRRWNWSRNNLLLSVTNLLLLYSYQLHFVYWFKCHWMWLLQINSWFKKMTFVYLLLMWYNFNDLREFSVSIFFIILYWEIRDYTLFCEVTSLDNIRGCRWFISFNPFEFLGSQYGFLVFSLKHLWYISVCTFY